MCSLTRSIDPDFSTPIQPLRTPNHKGVFNGVLVLTLFVVVDNHFFLLFLLRRGDGWCVRHCCHSHSWHHQSGHGRVQHRACLLNRHRPKKCENLLSFSGSGSNYCMYRCWHVTARVPEKASRIPAAAAGLSWASHTGGGRDTTNPILRHSMCGEDTGIKIIQFFNRSLMHTQIQCTLPWSPMLTERVVRKDNRVHMALPAHIISKYKL